MLIPIINHLIVVDIYISLSLYLSLSLSIYIYIYIYAHTFAHYHLLQNAARNTTNKQHTHNHKHKQQKRTSAEGGGMPQRPLPRCICDIHPALQEKGVSLEYGYVFFVTDCRLTFWELAVGDQKQVDAAHAPLILT